ncbi:MAG: NUDIX domain-containing protein [Bacteroidetes bacterium]|nr:NUDIX domain-containing protein [Bacteroidota bacterium]
MSVASVENTRSAGGVVLNQTGQVVVVNQNGTSWSLPKGHLEANETPLQAAIREIEEECGITELQLIRELGMYQRYRIGLDGTDDPSELKTIIMFLFSTHEQILKPTDHQNPEARWIEKTQVTDLLTHPKDKEFFESVCDLISL